MQAFNEDLEKSGELVDTRGLTVPAHARRVQVQKSVPVVTDGPYAETEEVLAGACSPERLSSPASCRLARHHSHGPERISGTLMRMVRTDRGGSIRSTMGRIRCRSGLKLKAAATIKGIRYLLNDAAVLDAELHTRRTWLLTVGGQGV